MGYNEIIILKILCSLLIVFQCFGYEVYVEVTEDDGTYQRLSFTEEEEKENLATFNGTLHDDRKSKQKRHTKRTTEEEEESYEECIKRITRIRGGQYMKAITVELSDVMRLPCHFCGDNAEAMLAAKTWFKFSKMLDADSGDIVWRPTEVDLDMHDEDDRNRVYVLPDHTLVMENFDVSDKGTYFCHHYQASDDAIWKYAFRAPDMTGISAASMAAVFKQLTGDTHVSFLFFVDMDLPIKAQLVTADGKGFPKPIKPLQNATANWILFTTWEQWSECNSCDEPGERRRKGHCRVGAIKHNRPTTPDYIGEMVSLYPDGAPCHSTLFVHDIVILERPHEIEIGGCWELCKPAPARHDRSLRAFRRRQRRGMFDAKVQVDVPKLSRSKIDLRTETRDVVAEVGDKIEMICTGASSGNSVRWNKDRVRMDTRLLAIITLGRIRVTASHKLIIRRVIASDNATYACWYAIKGHKREKHAVYTLIVDIEQARKDMGMYFFMLVTSYGVNGVIFIVLLLFKSLTRAHFQQRKYSRLKTKESDDSDSD